MWKQGTSAQRLSLSLDRGVGMFNFLWCQRGATTSLYKHLMFMIRHLPGSISQCMDVDFDEQGSALSTRIQPASESYRPPSRPITSVLHKCECMSMMTAADDSNTT